MASLGTTPDRDHHQLRPGDPRPLGPRADRRRPASPRSCAACDELERFRQRQREPLRAGPGLAVPPRDLPLRRPGRPDGPADRADPVRRVQGPDGAAVRAGDRRVPRGDARRRPQRRDRQRPGAGLRADRLPDPGRPGAAVGPELPGQPLDVPRRRRSTSIPLRIHPRLLERESDDALFPILVERTPVRLDLSHSAWSDIFFLGMDYPEGARVLNISVDLGVHGRDDQPRSRRSRCRVRVIAEPLLRLTSIDLNACKDVDDARRAVQLRQRLPRPGQGRRDRLGPDPAVARGDRGAARRPAGAGGPAGARPGGRQQGQRHPQGVAAGGLDEPAGLADRLLMRATGQARNLTGPLDPEEARVVVARAILGEWLGGSGGGWQDSGGDLPRGQADPGRARPARATPSGGSAGAGCCPRTSCSTATGGDRPPRTPARRLPRGPGAEPGARPRRHGPERRADPEHGHRASTCSASRDEWQARQEALRDLRRDRRAPSSAADVRALGAADHPELGRAAQGDHPLGQQRVHRGDHPRGAGRRWATTSGAS